MGRSTPRDPTPLSDLVPLPPLNFRSESWEKETTRDCWGRGDSHPDGGESREGQRGTVDTPPGKTTREGTDRGVTRTVTPTRLPVVTDPPLPSSL